MEVGGLQKYSKSCRQLGDLAAASLCRVHTVAISRSEALGLDMALALAENGVRWSSGGHIYALARAQYFP
eukprot:6093879-Prymnesium_polylepis.1